MKRGEHSVPRKITSCPALCLLSERFLRNGSCLGALSTERHAAPHKGVLFLGRPSSRGKCAEWIKCGFWRQEVLFRNNVPFPAAQDCQPYSCFWRHRNSRVGFLPSTPDLPIQQQRAAVSQRPYLCCPLSGLGSKQVPIPLTETKLRGQRTFPRHH